MCGICGQVSFGLSQCVDEGIVRKMLNKLVHRGPDDEGVYISGNVGLGIRRLAIIDLEGGIQPICNEDKTKWLICNGEIYNSPTLRRSLIRLGHEFRTGSDVEVILHAYEEYGEEFLDFINGIFSFALWDERKKTLLIARDRFGVKPLYYTRCNNSLIFASELKSLMTHPDISKELDTISLYQYLSFDYVPTPRSIFKNVYKLSPGHILRFSKENLQVKSYWDLSFKRSESSPPICWQETKGAFLQLFESSVAKEMLSDVPVGVFLSGGLDSSAVAAMAVSQSTCKLDSFTAIFDDISFDESLYARKVSKILNTNHHEATITPQACVDVAEQVSQIMDEPFGDSSVIPTFLVSKLASQHVKVVLSGDGGDEMFAGYPTYLAHKLVGVYESVIPYYLRANVIPQLVSRIPVSFNNISFDFQAKKFLSGRGVPLGVRHHKWLGSFDENQKASLFNQDLSFEEIDTYKIVASHLNRCDATEALNQMLYCDSKLYLEGDILTKVDRASMANSLEVRVPLLNSTLSNFVTTLPLSLKMKGLTGKYLLKKSMEGILPKEIICRKKKGFNIPTGKMFLNELKPFLLDHLSSSFIKQQDIFEEKFIYKLMDDHLQKRQDNRKLLWNLCMFQQWYRLNF